MRSSSKTTASFNLALLTRRRTQNQTLCSAGQSLDSDLREEVHVQASRRGGIVGRD